MSKLTFVIVFLFLTTAAWAAPFPSGWARSCKLTVDHTKVTGTHKNFPVLVGYYAGENSDTNIPDEMMLAGGANAAQANGGDIRFTLDAYGTIPLNYEIVSFTQADPVSNARAEIWVKLPSISSATDTDFYVWYDAADAQTTPDANDPHWGSQGVWSNNYVGVWHLNDPTDPVDSTRYGNDGTNSGTTAATGKLGGCGGFDGVNDKINIPGTGNLYFNQKSFFTMQAWAKKLGNTGINVMGIFLKDGRYGIDYWWAGDQIRSGIRNSIEGQQSFNATPTGSLLVWNHVVFTYEPELATGMRLYINGALGNTHTNVNYHDFGTSSNYIVGGNAGLGGDPTYFYGTLDELRISSAIRSADWIATEYANQNAPESFITDSAPVEAKQPSTMISVGSITGVSAVVY